MVNADSTISAAGEVNADDTGSAGSGGLISFTAPTVTVAGTLHANGGGEVNLQACSLTLEPSGQLLATGSGGFTQLQAGGPMEIDGTLVADGTNTLDYLDPAAPSVVNAVSISPDADIVENVLPVQALCPGQLTTTTTLASCSPPGCDDRGPCMPGTCVDGVCQYAPMTGMACATITLDQFRGLVDGALADAFKSRSMRRKLAGRLRHVTTLVDVAGRGTVHPSRARRRAERALSSLARLVDRSAGHHRIDGSLAESLGNLATEARSALAS